MVLGLLLPQAERMRHRASANRTFSTVTISWNAQATESWASCANTLSACKDVAKSDSIKAVLGCKVVSAVYAAGQLANRPFQTSVMPGQHWYAMAHER